jgi:hypothetical protein
MFHFQTKEYEAHKASDKYLKNYRKNLDRFMEVYQGIQGRITENQINISFPTVDDTTIVGHLEAMKKYLLDLNKMKLSLDLATIRDEMMADINQFLYLLTFK